MKEDDTRFSACAVPVINYEWLSHLMYKNETRQVLGKKSWWIPLEVDNYPNYNSNSRCNKGATDNLIVKIITLI